MAKVTSYKKGKRVTILNQSLHGNTIIEGEATLIRETYSFHDQYPAWQVLFEGEGETPVNRVIYPQADIDKVANS